MRPVLSCESSRVSRKRRLALSREPRVEWATILRLIVGVHIAPLPLHVRPAVHLLSVELVQLLSILRVVVLALLVGRRLPLRLDVVVREVLLGHSIGPLRDPINNADI